MEREQIKQEMIRLFKFFFKNDNLKITESTSANDVDNWDSLSHASLISTIEDEFHIRIKLKELIAMRNVGDLIENVFSKTSEKIIA